MGAIADGLDPEDRKAWDLALKIASTGCHYLCREATSDAEREELLDSAVRMLRSHLRLLGDRYEDWLSGQPVRVPGSAVAPFRPPE